MDVLREAADRVAAMTALMGDMRPDLIPLSECADEATFNFLLPISGWAFLERQAVSRFAESSYTRAD
jgi:hypothetical protein